MTQLQQLLYDQILADRDYVIALRRELHQHPELGREEYETQAILERELDKLGLAHRRAAETGVIAVLDGCAPAEGEPRCIALRADIDALPIREESGAPYASRSPGKMHACGHDAHTAALMGAARVLSRNRDRFSGRVLFIWQPGEEIGYGGRAIVESGAIDGAGRSFGVHVAPEIDAGSLVLMEGANNASVDWFRIRIHGRGAHVSTPEKGVDAVYIASQIVVGLQALITRCSNPMENVLIGVGRISAGNAYNVVAREGVLEGTLRALNEELRAATRERMALLAENTAAVYGGTAELEWLEGDSPALINDPEATREAQQTAVSLFGADHVITRRRASLSGDDFADFILRAPGTYAYVGSGNDGDPRTRAGIHSSCFEIDESCLTVAAALYACYSTDYLTGRFL